jgi:hypothetical protein
MRALKTFIATGAALAVAANSPALSACCCAKKVEVQASCCASPVQQPCDAVSSCHCIQSRPLPTTARNVVVKPGFEQLAAPNELCSIPWPTVPAPTMRTLAASAPTPSGPSLLALYCTWLK